MTKLTLALYRFFVVRKSKKKNYVSKYCAIKKGSFSISGTWRHLIASIVLGTFLWQLFTLPFPLTIHTTRLRKFLHSFYVETPILLCLNEIKSHCVVEWNKRQNPKRILFFPMENHRIFWQFEKQLIGAPQICFFRTVSQCAFLAFSLTAS